MFVQGINRNSPREIAFSSSSGHRSMLWKGMPGLFPLLLAMMALVKEPCFAGKTHWLTDYASAMKAAKKTGKPVLLDFSTTWCGWCRKMERDVFDSAEFSKVAKSSILLRIDGDRNRELVAEFGVRGYPTFFFISPVGKTKERILGYKPKKEFIPLMEKFLAKVKPAGSSRRRSAMTSMYAKAENALRKGEYRESLKAINRILAARGDSPEKDKARQLLIEIEAKGYERLGEAKRLEDAERYGKALAAYAKISRIFKGTAPSKTAIERLKSLKQNPKLKARFQEQAAEELHNEAVVAEKTRRYVRAMKLYRSIVREYPGTTAAKKAKDRIDALNSVPEIATSLKSAAMARRSRSWLSIGRQWAKMGKTDKAREYLQKVIDACPDSEYASQAKEELAKLGE